MHDPEPWTVSCLAPLRGWPVLMACVLCVASAAVAAPAADGVDFNRDVRPILSDKCYFCHGPDEAHRQADLRLDNRDSAIGVIEAGDLIERISSTDPDVVMPPPDSNLSLTTPEKQTLRDWVAAGAVYDEHWAFKLLPDAVAVPEGSDWCRQTLDRFVLAKLNAEGLEPAAAASPRRWLRRVTLDLTGLLPTLEQIDAFESAYGSRGAAACEAVVEALLESPAFGEHMAVAWLDAARYADSYGYQSDKLNTQWPYRDWVVRAFNDNLPYDKFLTWQLAGDLLEKPTRDQKLATAFNRLHRLNNEGGAVFEEWRVENVADRVHTFGTAVLGVTMECCRCHDHKYDPIPTRDYYSLSAFFNSIDESGVYDRTEKVPCPSLLLPTPQQIAALQAALDQLAAAEARYAQVRADAERRHQTWMPPVSGPPIPDLKLALAFDRPFDNSLKAIYHPSESDRAWTSMPQRVPVVDCRIARLSPAAAADEQAAATARQPAVDDTAAADRDRLALRLDGERGITTHGVTPFDRWTPFSVVVTFREPKRSSARSIIAHHTRGTDCGYNGWDLTIENGYLESRMARVWPGNAMSVRTVEPIPADRWHQVAATYDGSSKAGGLRLFLNGVELRTRIVRDNVKKQANVVVDHGGEFVVGQRFRARGLDGGLIDDVRVYERALTAGELRHLATGEPIPLTPEYFASAVDGAARDAAQQLAAARMAVVMAEEVMTEIPVMQEMSQPRPTHVLARGRYDAPKNDATLVTRNTFTQFALPFPADAPRNRLGLAAWVTDPRHPLTSRVAVNRFWANFFGEPLVRTPENFGLQGELPTHPELLDWLARDFVSSGWDVKRLCRQIVLSAAYRQDSRAPAHLLQRDPKNRLLARGPAHRLAAEQIRDLALASSGLLNLQRGGPPVSPYQPGADLWRESNGMSPPYQQSVGRALYRRSLYSVWKRTAPLPNMMALDATTREVCTVRRSRTNTPLQALVLMNDPQFVEAARVLATDVLDEENDSAALQLACRRLAGRPADDRELQMLSQLLADERAFFVANPAMARQLISIGEAKAPAGVQVTELAAMTTVCQAILNLDATIWKR